MNMIATIAQLIIAFGIFNVWILRYNRATAFRPAGASNMPEEFRKYGLPAWMTTAVGATKLTLAVLLLVGAWFTLLAVPASVAMALLMAAAVLAHVRVGDPLSKSVPALTMLGLSAIVIVTRTV